MQIAQRLGRLAADSLIRSVMVLGIEGAAFADVAVPPELRGWEEWALQGHETHRCPWLTPGTPDDATRICAWPSVLDLQADERGARFSQRWQTAAETWLPLPGSAENWPEDVTLDGAPAAVVAHDGAPARALPHAERPLHIVVVVQARHTRLGAVAVLRSHSLDAMGVAGVHARWLVATRALANTTASGARTPAVRGLRQAPRPQT